MKQYTGGNNLATTLPVSYGQVCAVEQVVDVGENSLVLELKDLAKRQSQDNDMAGMIAYLKDGTLPDDERSSHRVVLESKHFELVDEVLYHKNAVFPGRCCAVVLQEVRQSLLEEAHQGRFAGHLSGKKVYDRLRRQVRWKGVWCVLPGKGVARLSVLGWFPSLLVVPSTA